MFSSDGHKAADELETEKLLGEVDHRDNQAQSTTPSVRVCNNSSRGVCKVDRVSLLTAAALGFLVLVCAAIAVTQGFRCLSRRPFFGIAQSHIFGDQVPPLGVSEGVIRNWAQYSPYVPAGIYIPPPPGCRVSQVRPACAQ